MQALYVLFGGVSILGGVVEVVYGYLLGGLMTIAFGIIVTSLYGIAGAIGSLRDRVAELERAGEKSKLAGRPVATPSPPSDATALGAEPTAADIEAAKALLATAQDQHFSKHFDAARETYQQIVDRHGNTKQAAVARQQLANLRGV